MPPLLSTDDPVRVDVPPTAAFLVLVTGALLLLLVVAALVVNCAIRKLKKKAPAITEQQLDVTSRTNRRGINRVRLNSQGWQHTSEEGYTPLSSAAPPSYTDTIRADQEAQHHHSLQAVSLSSMSCSPQTTEEINEHLSRDSSTNIDS